MEILNQSFTFSTKGEIEFIDLTGKVREVVERSGIQKWVDSCFRSPRYWRHHFNRT